MGRKDQKERNTGMAVDRRKFLRRTGASAAVGLAGVGTVNAQLGNDLNRVQFIEAGYKHNLDIDDDELIRDLHLEEWISHTLVDSSKLILWDRMPQMTTDLFKEQGSILQIRGEYRSFPMDRISIDPSPYLTTILDSSHRAVYGVELTEPYAPPAIELSESGGDLSVLSGGINDEVVPGEQKSFSFSQQKGEIVTFVPTDETAQSTQPGETNEEYETSKSVRKATTFVPELVVQNYGEVSVEGG